MRYIIAYDLGTGGAKTSLFDENGISQASAFHSYEISFPKDGWHEQRPEDWWNGVVCSTRKMLSETGISPEQVEALAVSGTSLGVVPIGKDGTLLAEFVPLWSDGRAVAQAEEFFRTQQWKKWYPETGNGFPAHLYSIFKMMWYRDHMPELYEKTRCFLGTKDYINYKMTGVLCTDRSYASGSGVYSLTEEGYRQDFIRAAGVDGDKLPPVFPSTHVLGTLLPEAAGELGLSVHTKVCAGGVDNACMALGAGCIADGESYISMGSSSWIAVSGSRPVINTEKPTYVFAHCVPGQYVSATSIFAAGSSLRWVRDTVCPDFLAEEQAGGPDSYLPMNALAEKIPAGAHRLIFNPSLAGGSGLDKSDCVKGCFTGLTLMHTRADLIRATMEGVAMNLRLALDVLEENVPLRREMLMVGGGGKSPLWRGIFASVFEKDILQTNVGQDAGSLGAAAVAAVGVGLWENFDRVKKVHRLQSRVSPDPGDAAVYRRMMPVFAKICDIQSDVGEMLHTLEERQ